MKISLARKALVLFMIVSILIAGGTGCGSSSNTEAYEKAAEKFLTVLLTYEDAEKIVDSNDLNDVRMSYVKKMKSYMTDEGYKEILGTREVYRTVTVGFNKKSKVTVKAIDLKYQNKDSETDGLVYNYTVNVNLEPFSGGTAETVEVWGQLQVKKAGMRYKINRIYFEGSNRWFDVTKGL